MTTVPCSSQPVRVRVRGLLPELSLALSLSVRASVCWCGVDMVVRVFGLCRRRTTLPQSLGVNVRSSLALSQTRVQPCPRPATATATATLCTHSQLMGVGGVDDGTEAKNAAGRTTLPLSPRTLSLPTLVCIPIRMAPQQAHHDSTVTPASMADSTRRVVDSTRQTAQHSPTSFCFFCEIAPPPQRKFTQDTILVRVCWRRCGWVGGWEWDGAAAGVESAYAHLGEVSGEPGRPSFAKHHCSALSAQKLVFLNFLESYSTVRLLHQSQWQ